jgi:hypothetical protein
MPGLRDAVQGLVRMLVGGGGAAAGPPGTDGHAAAVSSLHTLAQTLAEAAEGRGPEDARTRRALCFTTGLRAGSPPASCLCCAEPGCDGQPVRDGGGAGLEMKERGNACFKSKDFAAAAKQYELGLDSLGQLQQVGSLRTKPAAAGLPY